MLPTSEFIRRFLMHVLPQGFHRIRYYGLLASHVRADNVARIRQMLAPPLIPIDAINAAAMKPNQPETPQHPCPCCGGRMLIIETSIRNNVVLPQPDGPMMQTKRFSTTSKEMSRRMTRAWSPEP